MKTNKYNAKMTIYNDLLAGKRVSQLDCKQYQIEDMRTTICHLKDRFPSTHILCKRWIVSPKRKSRIKEYWLEEAQSC